MRKPYPHALRHFKQFDPASVFPDHVRQYKESGENWAWGCCPFHTDRNPSFSMNTETGAYRCLSGHCAVSGPTVVSFIRALYELDTRSALDHLENHYG